MIVEITMTIVFWLQYLMTFEKISNINTYQSLVNNQISHFVSCELMKQSIKCEFKNFLMGLNTNDEFYEAKKIN